MHAVVIEFKREDSCIFFLVFGFQMVLEANTTVFVQMRPNPSLLHAIIPDQLSALTLRQQLHQFLFESRVRDGIKPRVRATSSFAKQSRDHRA